MTNSTRIWMIVAIAALSAAYWYITKPEPSKTPPQPIVVKTGQALLRDEWDKVIGAACKPPLGNSKAEWSIVEVGDFQCPQCGKVHGTVEKLIGDSGGHAKLYFINWPLNMHANARAAALAALAAEKQGKFWPMYGQIYDAQSGLEGAKADRADAILTDDAKRVGLDLKAFDADRASDALKMRLNQQMGLAVALDTQSTPTFYVRKNGSPTIYWFIGLKGQEPTPMTPRYPGLETLIANAPWHGRTLPPPTDQSAPPTPPMPPAPGQGH